MWWICARYVRKIRAIFDGVKMAMGRLRRNLKIKRVEHFRPEIRTFLVSQMPLDIYNLFKVEYCLLCHSATFNLITRYCTRGPTISEFDVFMIMTFWKQPIILLLNFFATRTPGPTLFSSWHVIFLPGLLSSNWFVRLNRINLRI